MSRIIIPVLFKTEKAVLDEKRKYKQWELADPSPEEIREDELWYTQEDKVEETKVSWPKDCIGHFHEAEGGNTILHHANYDARYIVPMNVDEFNKLIQDNLA